MNGDPSARPSPLLARPNLPPDSRAAVKILIIEDDPKTAQSIRQGLRQEGYGAAVAHDGDAGWALLTGESCDLVVLDWMLPRRDGIEILRALKRSTAARPPVLLLTARDAIEDRVLGLDSGADDYLVKPFAFAELLARIRALLRRLPKEDSWSRRAGDLSLNLQTRRVFRAQEEIPLTPREFDLLVCLLKHQGQIVTRQMLAREVWREPNRATAIDNVIDVHLARLRKKIDEGRRPRLLQTVRGVGLMLKEHSA